MPQIEDIKKELQKASEDLGLELTPTDIAELAELAFMVRTHQLEV